MGDLNQDAEKLKAQERAAQEEKMLGAIRRDRDAGISPVHDKNGNPLNDVESVNKRREELAKEEMERISKELIAMMNKDPDLEESAKAIQGCYQMLLWLLAEVSMREGMSDKLTSHLSAVMRKWAESDYKSYPEIIANMKQNVLPLIKRRGDRVAAKLSARRIRAERISKKFCVERVPLASLNSITSARVGEIVVVYGDMPAVKLAIRKISEEFFFLHKLKPIVLAMDDKEFDKSKTSPIPVVWWENAATKPRGLETALDAAINDKESLVLMVENAVGLQASDLSSGFYALGTVMRLCQEMSLVGIVGVFSGDNVAFPESLPFDAVKVSLVDEQLVCERTHKGARGNKHVQG